jgi:hypothetical protein
LNDFEDPNRPAFQYKAGFEPFRGAWDELKEKVAGVR